jgi:hypothetical protein
MSPPEIDWARRDDELQLMERQRQVPDNDSISTRNYN